MASIDEVARRAGVSTATVSRVLNRKQTVSPGTTSRVMRAVEELNYVISSSASGLASGRTKNVGVLVPEITRWYFATVIEGIAAALNPYGYDLTFYSVGGGDKARKRLFEQNLHRKRVDAFIAISQEICEHELRRIQTLGKPIVGVGGPLPGVTTFSINDIAVGREATQHLIDLGHTSIAHLSGTIEFEADFHLPTNRRTGYESALNSAGIPIPHHLQAEADFTIEGGYHATLELLRRPGASPTAMFVSSDEMAIGAILALRELGLTAGKDLSIVGVDNHDLAELFSLTTIAQYPKEQGALAVEALMRQLDPDAVPQQSSIELTTTFIKRGSTGPAPAPAGRG